MGDLKMFGGDKLDPIAMLLNLIDKNASEFEKVLVVAKKKGGEYTAFSSHIDSEFLCTAQVKVFIISVDAMADRIVSE